MRGEVYRLKAPKDARDHEQDGSRFAVVVQSSDLPLSTWVVCPTSSRAQSASFRPVVDFGRGETLVLVDQIAAISPGRLGAKVGFLSLAEMQEIDKAIRTVLDV